MRRAIVPSILVLIFLICAGNPPVLRADPIAFVITWSLSSVPSTPGPGPTSYTYDPVTAFFTGFVVSWQGFAWDLAAVVNTFTQSDRVAFQAALLDPTDNLWNVQRSDVGGAFHIFPSPSTQIVLCCLPPPGPASHASGSFAVAQAQASVPEPATLTLCGIGAGGLLLTRYARSKRRKRPHM